VGDVERKARESIRAWRQSVSSVSIAVTHSVTQSLSHSFVRSFRSLLFKNPQSKCKMQNAKCKSKIQNTKQEIHKYSDALTRSQYCTVQYTPQWSVVRSSFSSSSCLVVRSLFIGLDRLTAHCPLHSYPPARSLPQSVSVEAAIIHSIDRSSEFCRFL